MMDRPRAEWNDLAEKMERCGRLISHCLGKRRGQGRILRTLCQRGEMPQKELQDLLGIQAGSMSEIAAKLEAKGLIVRVRSEEDRRKVCLSVTGQGRDWVAQRDEAHIRRHRAELFSALTPEEQAGLEVLLDKLSADWSQRLDPRGRCCPEDGTGSAPEAPTETEGPANHLKREVQTDGFHCD